MRCVVVSKPAFDFFACVAKESGPVPVQAVGSELSAEALDKGIPRRSLGSVVSTA